MKALLDLTTKKVKGFNRPKGLLEFEVEIYDMNIEKIIDTQKYSLLENPSLFDLDDLTVAKGKQLIDQTKKYILLNEELSEDILDLQDPKHSANTGFKFLQLKPHGQCKTKQIDLPELPKNLFFYLESQDDIEIEVSPDGKVFHAVVDQAIEFQEPISKIFLKFINPTNENKNIFSYGILF